MRRKVRDDVVLLRPDLGVGFDLERAGDAIESRVGLLAVDDPRGFNGEVRGDQRAFGPVKQSRLQSMVLREGH